MTIRLPPGQSPGRSDGDSQAGARIRQVLDLYLLLVKMVVKPAQVKVLQVTEPNK